MKLIKRVREGDIWTNAVFSWKWVSNVHGFHVMVGFFGKFSFRLTRWDGHWFFEKVIL